MGQNRHRLGTGDQRGTTLIEVMIAIALSGVLLPALATALLTAHANSAAPTAQLEAAQLTHEAEEAVRSARDSSWDNVASNGTFHPVVSSNGWTLVNGSETINGYTRSVVIGDVQRNSAGDITASGGSVDPSTRMVTTTVSWSQPSSRSVQSVLYLTRWQHDSIWQQTLASDFSAGVLSDTAVTANGDGEVALSGTPGSYPASGSYESTTFDADVEAAWQRLQFTATTPGNSTVRFQLATNTDNTTWDYAGPDGTDGTYFTADSPLTGVAGRYIRFKVFFTAATGGTDTPVLSSVQLEYSR